MNRTLGSADFSNPTAFMRKCMNRAGFYQAGGLSANEREDTRIELWIGGLFPHEKPTPAHLTAPGA
ncbi:hypothetical protein [Salinisphaera sp. T5B8]|uniref:hypothetical protein n=1 Tax=Salinisphaera sp. T5B8 TaxID=1304154 RepID=UPI003340F5B0